MPNLYVDETYYKENFLGKISDADLPKKLLQAQRHVDSLTFNRIVGIGFDNLTPFQQSVIKEVVCLQVDFEEENKELLQSFFSSYSINGVSMDFSKSWNLHLDNGVAMQKSTYEMLKQTGLTDRVIR